VKVIISSRGQVALPKTVRDAVGLKPGDEVEVRATASGESTSRSRGSATPTGRVSTPWPSAAPFAASRRTSRWRCSAARAKAPARRRADHRRYKCPPRRSNSRSGLARLVGRATGPASRALADHRQRSDLRRALGRIRQRGRCRGCSRGARCCLPPHAGSGLLPGRKSVSAVPQGRRVPHGRVAQLLHRRACAGHGPAHPHARPAPVPHLLSGGGGDRAGNVRLARRSLARSGATS
jgi:AbrB family looped-hinge helix DNA binding protein